MHIIYSCIWLELRLTQVADMLELMTSLKLVQLIVKAERPNDCLYSVHCTPSDIQDLTLLQYIDTSAPYNVIPVSFNMRNQLTWAWFLGKILLLIKLTDPPRQAGCETIHIIYGWCQGIDIRCQKKVQLHILTMLTSWRRHKKVIQNCRGTARNIFLGDRLRNRPSSSCRVHNECSSQGVKTTALGGLWFMSS